MSTPLRLGSANFYQRSIDSRAEKALRMFAPMCDVMGPLEFGGIARRHMLEDLCAEGEYGFYKPRNPGSAPALVWDTKRVMPVETDTVLLAPSRRVRPIPGRKAVQPDIWGSYGIFEDLIDGGTFWVGSWHSPAHVEFWFNTGRRAMYQEALAALLAERRGQDRWAILGDWNVEISKPKQSTWVFPHNAIARRNGRFMWQGHPARKGTHGKRRVIDGAASNMKVLKTRVVESGVGDHDFALGLFDPAKTLGGG